MALSAVTLTFILLVCHCPLRVDGSQSAMQMLNAGSSDLLKEGSSYQSKKDEETASPDYISDLWSNIEDAFKFLEEQPPQAAVRERLLLQDLQRSRKNEKINRLPFTQHHFIRFGKRLAPNQDIKSLYSKSDLSQVSITPGRQFQGILNRIRDRGLAELDNESPEISYPIQLETSGDSDLPDLEVATDVLRKRNRHNFVRFGKRNFYATHPFQVEGDSSSVNENAQSPFLKRVFSKFVRIG